MVSRKILLTGLLSCLTILLYGQKEELFFKHLTADDGLSHNSVYSINEDSLGFIWIGTRSGLNRFDGSEFKIYDNNQGLNNTYINAIFRDSRGRIWIGTQEGGLSLYNYETDNFTSWSNKPDDSTSISHDNVLSVAEDFEGKIWIGTYDGSLNRFNENDGSFSRIIFKEKLPDKINIDRINTMFFESDSILWLGTYRGLFRYNKKLEILTPISLNGKFLNAWITGFYNENSQILWIGTKAGLIRFDKAGHTGEFITSTNSQLSSDLITDIKPLPDKRLLIATDGGGLNIINLSSNEIVVYKSDPNNEYSLSNNSVYKIFVDKYNALWIGNYIGGINYYSRFDLKFMAIRHELNNPESLSDNHVRTFFEDREGKIWIGTLGGFNLYDAKTDKFSAYTFDRSVENSLSSNSVLSIYEDRKGFLWIGTFGGGISIFDKHKKTFKKYRNNDDKSNSLDKANVYKILETDNSKLCIASLGGIYLIDINSGRMKRFLSSNSDLSNNTVKALCKDYQGNIWIGTNRGLNKFNPETEVFEVFLHSISNANSLSNNRVLCILNASDGRIWVGTEGGGVSIFNPANVEFNTITTNEGLPDNVINSIVQDNNGVFWFSTNKGLVRYDESSKKMLTYTIADGLQGNEFYQNSVLKTSDGKLFFGGPSGFNSFYPYKLVYNTYPPKITLTDLFISNRFVRVTDKNSPIKKQMSLLKRITLPYQSNFEIHFSVLGFINKGKYLCSYYMRGTKEDWTEFKNVRSANFANLDPGKYTFMVKAVNNDGFSSESQVSIEIVILSPWWKTWWAFIIYAFVVGSLLLIFMRINYLKVRAKHQLFAKTKEKEQLEELNSMKLRFFTDISHEFKTPLTLILGHLDNIKHISSEKREETMSSIERNAKRLLMLINQLLEFRKAESGLMKLKTTKGNILVLLNSIKESFNELAEIKNISFELNCHDLLPEMWFDSEKMEKIIFNLLSNSFKATGEGGEIRIEVKLAENNTRKSFKPVKDQITISVIDSGSGIAPEEIDLIFERFYHNQKNAGINLKSENSGIGLAYSKRLVELHHGEISVISEKGRGSTFTIKLPLGKDHLSDDEIKDDTNFQLRMDYQAITNEILDVGGEYTELQSTDNKLPIMLIVDDNPEVCNVLAGKFQHSFFILTAFNGETGLKKACRYLPDIVISDIMMPIVDGYEFCHRIKTNLMTSHIPVILLTAKSGEENQITGYRSGADAYISKPYNPELLEVTAQNLIQNRQLLRKKFIQQSSFIPSEIIDNKLDEEFLNKLISRIENEPFSENIDVASLCREIAMSRSVLYRKIKMLTGNSIQEFVRLVKLRKASRMLIESSVPISEIAYCSGFTNTKHFSTAFKKLFGKTPSEYRLN
jgi:signal transduction histidine kinase/ligand-binding sensor domain-containing protein/AraC-like DNA-binding protein